MKKKIAIIIVVIITVFLCAFGTKKAIDENKKDLTTTTEATETTTEEIITKEAEEVEVEETTTDVVEEEETERYENPNYYKRLIIWPSDIPFKFGWSDAVESVYLYVPVTDISESSGDTWDNAIVVVEHKKDYPVILKLDKADGINTGNIVLREGNMLDNHSFIYLDGEYSKNYTVTHDGDMIILKDFPKDAREIQLHNRSVFSIYEDSFYGEKVSVNDIIIKIVD